MAIDLNSLSDEVLLYSNEQFYKFIENCLGIDEMNLLKLQLIKNVRTLLKVPDIFSVLTIKCKELLDLKSRLCFIDDDNENNMIIKAGVKTNFDDLITALKEKNSKYLKRTKNSKLSSSSLTTNTRISTTPSLNTSSSNVIDLSLTSTSTTELTLMSINDYIQVISDSIEKYSMNNFENIILKHNNDYVIHLNQLDTSVNGYIKCNCNSKIKLAFRSHTKSFQLSQYYKHIKASRCSMMKKKRQESNKTNSISHNIMQNNNFPFIEDENIIKEEIMNALNENSQITTNTSISNDSYVFRKRALSSSSSSSLDSTKKQKHLSL
jgi:hypothetical protein